MGGFNVDILEMHLDLLAHFIEEVNAKKIDTLLNRAIVSFCREEGRDRWKRSERRKKLRS